MPHTRVRVEFTALPSDTDIVRDRLTRELAADLAELGEVTGVPAPPPVLAKSATELAIGALGVLAGTDPAYLQSLVDIVVAFLQRHRGRRVHLQVGDAQLTIDRPTGTEVAELIRLMEKAIDRDGADADK